MYCLLLLQLVKRLSRLLGARISRYGLLSEGCAGGGGGAGGEEGGDAVRALGNKLQKQKRRMHELTRLVERNLELTRAVAEKMEVLGGADGVVGDEDSDANESSEAGSATGNDAADLRYENGDAGISTHSHS